MNEFLKESTEMKINERPPQFDFYKGICGLVKESETYRPEGAFPDQILKNLNKGSNTYEGFEDKAKQKPKMYDEFTLKVVIFKISHSRFFARNPLKMTSNWERIRIGRQISRMTNSNQEFLRHFFE